MKKIIIVCLVICLFCVCGCSTTTTASKTVETPKEVKTSEGTFSEEGTIEIEDMAGRKVAIPKTVKSVFGVNNNSSIFLYTLAPDLMIGWNSSLSPKSEKFIDSEIYNLPDLGTLYGNSKEVNLETIIAKKPDIILFLQPNINDTSTKAADELQKKLSIPVVMVDGNFNKYDLAYKFMGKILGREEKASELAQYCKETYEMVESVKDTYSSASPIRVYYGSGEDGLTTVAAGSSESATIDMLGALNVVDSKNLSKENSVISIEELMSLDPQLIILGNSGFSTGNAAENLSSTDGWKTLNAVQEGSVYSIPQLPFNWFDKPPSVNRILGIHWLISVLYPDYEQEDIVSQTKEYFDLFYHYKITDEQINKMLSKE